jgi:hypothetical protein
VAGHLWVFQDDEDDPEAAAEEEEGADTDSPKANGKAPAGFSALEASDGETSEAEEGTANGVSHGKVSEPKWFSSGRRILVMYFPSLVNLGTGIGGRSMAYAFPVGASRQEVPKGKQTGFFQTIEATFPIHIVIGLLCFFMRRMRLCPRCPT